LDADVVERLIGLQDVLHALLHLCVARLYGVLALLRHDLEEVPHVGDAFDAAHRRLGLGALGGRTDLAVQGDETVEVSR
jgi:hypothetical protein